MLKLFKTSLYVLLIIVFNTSIGYSMPLSMCPENKHTLLSNVLIKNRAPLSNSVIEFFANYTLHSLLGFNFVDYKYKIPAQNEYLYEVAWKEYIKFINAFSIKDVIEEKLLVSSYFKRPAEVVVQGNNVWRIKAPILIQRQSASEYTTVKSTITLDIVQDAGEDHNCGLKISKIYFDPVIKKSYPQASDFDDHYLPYKKIEKNKLSIDSSDLKQPNMDDDSLLVSVNLWIVKQENFDPSMLEYSPFITQKGILNDRYAWRVSYRSDNSILVTRTLNNQEGIDIQIQK